MSGQRLITTLLLFALLAAGGCTRPEQAPPAAPSGMPGHDMASASPSHVMSPSTDHHATPPGSPHVHTDYRLDLDVPPLKAGQPATLRGHLLDASGKPVSAFDVVHEKQVHMVAVRRDQRDFMHVHPEVAADGTLTQKLTFPFGGDWRIYVDASPTGAGQTVARQDVTVEGPSPAGRASLEADTRPKTVDGLTVSLFADPDPPSGSTMLTFLVESKGRPVTDLQPYLGAGGHLVALGKDAEPYLHVHPMGETPQPGKGLGPEVGFHVEFPAPGPYKLWLQLQRGGKVLTVPFVVSVR